MYKGYCLGIKVFLYDKKDNKFYENKNEMYI
jgi:hypothetical protein